MRRAAALALLILLPACGGGGGTTAPPPVAAPPGPLQANISILVANPVVSSGGVPGFVHSLRFALHVSESAGIGANLNGVGLAVFDAADSRLELTEIGADMLPGGNRLSANGSRDLDLTIGFNSDPLSGRYAHVLVNTTDDRGHNVLVPSERLHF